MDWIPTSSVGLAYYKLGFEYDPQQDIVKSIMYPLQRNLGYTWLYDVGASSLGFIIDCEPFYFDYNGKRWMIEPKYSTVPMETSSCLGEQP
jgi:hypothetical protein